MTITKYDGVAIFPKRCDRCDVKQKGEITVPDVEFVIKIPEKEFGIDINDKFQDFFSRLKAEIKAHLVTDTSLVCGTYELETIDMFLKAFNNGIPLPKGHGRLIDVSELLTVTDIREDGSEVTYVFYDEIDDAPTIIEAERECI